MYTLYFVMHFLRIWIIGRFDLEKNVLHTMSCMVKKVIIKININVEV